MHDIILNGEQRQVAAQTVDQLLNECNLADKRVAVELNRAIVPREQYKATSVKSGDQVEIVHFVGGG